MASKPGILSDWPWKPLGSFKYAILAPFVAQSIYAFIAAKREKERVDLNNFVIFPLLLLRVLHNQFWISLSRYQTANGNKRILDRGIDFDQVDRESNWDDQILMTAILTYVVNITVPGATHWPIWRTDGIILAILLHVGPVEFLYYWLHRALHHHFLYSRYHSHHHSSTVTEPITSVIHPFAEIMAYMLLFAIPLLALVLTGTGSLVAYIGYILYIDFMNNMGHCNFEVIPKWLFSLFPPLKYLMYTPSFHSLHHTQYRTNYSLFMPIYDYIYNTMDKHTDKVHGDSLEKPKELPNVVQLTHLTTPDAIYHLRLGFASLASRPQPYHDKNNSFLWYLWAVPVAYAFLLATWLCGPAFVVAERITFKKIVSQTWVIPKYKKQYSTASQRTAINNYIEEALLEAEKRGAGVLTLGLLNQGEELNRYGEVYTEKYPEIKVKVVDGSSLAAAVVLHRIPKGTTKVLLKGTFTKVASTIASTLCHKNIQVAVSHDKEYQKLHGHCGTNLVLATSYCDTKVWLIGDDLSEREQLKAPEGTIFIPYTQFPPLRRVRKDCFYHTTPSLLAPRSLENLHSCEDWLPRGVMSAWRVAGIVHALEEWNVHECGLTMFDIEKVWQAALQHGFQPYHSTTQSGLPLAI